MSPEQPAENNAPYIDRGEPLPGSYAENRIVAMTRGPDMIYVYWDIATEVRVAGNPLVLRTHCITEATQNDTQPDNGAENIYFHVTPNRAYQFELYERTPSGEFCLLANSDNIVTPVRRPDDFKGHCPTEITHAARHPLTRRPIGASPPPPPPKAETLIAPPTPRPSFVPTPAAGNIEGPFYQSSSPS